MPRIPPELCVRCKGYKLLCGLPRCPLLERFRAQLEAVKVVSDRDIVGYTPPSTLVGEAGYPKVMFYFMVPPGRASSEAAYYDAPAAWARNRESLSSIVRLRGSMISAFQRVDIHEPWRLYESEVGLAAISEIPVNSNVVLKTPPIPTLRFDGLTKPVGPRAPAERILVSDSPRLGRIIDNAIWDDAKASSVLVELYSKGIDIYRLQDLLSLGFLGKLRSRKMVPTRWAITAIDDIISRYLRERLRDRPSIDKIEVHEGEYLGNRFMIVLMPGEGAFEWIEAWHPMSAWAQGAQGLLVERVEEDPLGRASAMDGGFSAARLAVLEGLNAMGKIADVLIVREVLPSYYAPVGNWHIRETVRAAMRSQGRQLEGLEEVKELLRAWLKGPPEQVLRASAILGIREVRRKLTEFIR